HPGLDGRQPRRPLVRQLRPAAVPRRGLPDARGHGRLPRPPLPRPGGPGSVLVGAPLAGLRHGDRPAHRPLRLGEHAHLARLAGDSHAAYSADNDPGGGGPTSELTRQVVYLRPDYVLVYDRVTTVKDVYDKQLRWHFNQLPVLDGNAFTETVGGSRLFAQTF